MDLLQTAVWAFVVLCITGALVHVVRFIFGSAFEQTLSEVEAKVATADKLAFQVSSDLDKVGLEVREIRKGLEALKAIPPKQPRF
jgi:hypothetical protein